MVPPSSLFLYSSQSGPRQSASHIHTGPGKTPEEDLLSPRPGSQAVHPPTVPEAVTFEVHRPSLQIISVWVGCRRTGGATAVPWVHLVKNHKSANENNFSVYLCNNFPSQSFYNFSRTLSPTPLYGKTLPIAD